MKEIVLIGAGGHSKVVKDIIELNGDFKVVGYLDDKFSEKESENGVFFDSIDSFKKYKDYYFNISIGNNKIRQNIYSKLNLSDNKYPAFIHPTAIIGTDVHIGFGTVIMANVVINADTCVGKHSIINTMASVGHDVTINDFVHISPNSTLTGGVKVGSSSQIGASATVIPQKSIGKNTIVGAGATVVNDIEDNEVVVGTPAKPIRR